MVASSPTRLAAAPTRRAPVSLASFGATPVLNLAPRRISNDETTNIRAVCFRTGAKPETGQYGIRRNFISLVGPPRVEEKFTTAMAPAICKNRRPSRVQSQSAHRRCIASASFHSDNSVAKNSSSRRNQQGWVSLNRSSAKKHRYDSRGR